eukprot:CAMPEP_0184029368 /NCGR_PEP_ID=MMETSP0955-20130417/389_1 /TAXON_ID=627963 /ORGANISM="Aplanochytrium sp, Strain PBS07" /LENGTH=110 /DNA_ID=CAMNT_0026314405 /DNA_START=221 /DNA_END=553 /DNA_ORIENTATION=+
MDFQTENVMLGRKESTGNKYEEHMQQVYDNVKKQTLVQPKQPKEKVKETQAYIRRKKSLDPAIPDFVEDGFAMYQIPLHRFPKVEHKKQENKANVKRRSSLDYVQDAAEL